MSSNRVEHGRLLAFITDLFAAHGMSEEIAPVVARGFVEAELLGFRSHGLARVSANLDWLASGATPGSGTPRVLVDRPAVGNWDGLGLPGYWVMHLALAHAIERARDTGAFTMTLRRCQHVACLAAALLPAVEARMVALMMVSSPNEAFVSPFGGSGRLFSNNPLAFTAPGSLTLAEAEPPLLFDVSMAITAGSQVDRAGRLGRKLPEAAIKTASGQVSDDPAEFRQGGSVMPIGGLTHGHKGHALTLMTEVLTQALAGHGRSRSESENEHNSIYLQVLDPRAFADPEDYDREINHLQRMVADSPADDPGRPVRLPGRRAWAVRLSQMADGVDLDPGAMEALAPYAQKTGLELP